jgi:glycosyltransferase involved in cell wall biosynthesis
VTRVPLRRAADNSLVPGPPARPLGVIWEGSFFVHHSLANVNREVTMALARDRRIDLGLLPYEPDDFPPSAEPRYRLLARRMGHRPAVVHCHVRHRWPPDFSRPGRGAFVLVQPWEYGSLPRAWIRPITRTVDEVWVHTQYVRDIYLSSGVAPEKVQLIPLGVNPRLFRPGCPPLRLATRKRFRFLFVGGAILRKGFDLLLSAYAEEFSDRDDVCLVVKDFFYGGEAAADVDAARRRRRAPEILYSYGTIPYHALGRLYASCHCYVHPYRSEGFGLPILEAMACELPVIVTGSGAALDFCDDEVAYLIPSTERRVPIRLWDRRVPTVLPPTWFEPDVGMLRRAMRHVYEHRADAARKAHQARVRAARNWTWRHTTDAMLGRMGAWR